MRRSALVHRFRSEVTPDGNTFSFLVDSGFVVALGPGLVAGTPLLERVLGRVEETLLSSVGALGVQQASLPASEGEALVNLLAHLGWAGAQSGLAALGTGFRETVTQAEDLSGLSLYRRLDIVRLEGGSSEASESAAAGDVVTAVLGALAELGVPGPERDESGVIRAGGAVVGHAVRRSLQQDPDESNEVQSGAAPHVPDNLLLLDLDLYAVVGVLAEHHRDDRGVCWPPACAPYDVALVEAAGEDVAARQTSRKLEAELETAGFAVLRDDTGEPAGAQRQAAERLGIPIRVLCGPMCAQGVVVVEVRRGGAVPERVPVAGLMEWLERHSEYPLSSRTPLRRDAGRTRRLRALY
jgi:hypothetical protein